MDPGESEWGAAPGVEFFVLLLGESRAAAVSENL